MSEADPYSVPDGGTLRALASGLEIVRRQKHEWAPSLSGLSHDTLVRRTGKIWGRKFHPEWTLPVLVAWIEHVATSEGWTLQPGQSMQADWLLDRAAGLAAGEPTRKVRVVCDGRYVHAYPIGE